MNCQKCGTPVTPGKPFCDGCGAPVGTAAAAEAQKSGSNTTILVVVGVVIALGLFIMLIASGSGSVGGGGGGTLPAQQQAPVAQPAPTAPVKKIGYEKPEHALEAKLPSNWVYKLNASSTTRREFWAGPPASEYTSVYIVDRNSDGSWSVTDEYAIPAPQEPAAPANTNADAIDEAVGVVDDFLGYIRSDSPMSAHALCIEPFASDGASAQYSNGQFNSWTVEDTDLDTSDMSVWVDVTEYWDSGPIRMGYHAEPTQYGYRISKSEPW